MKQVTLTIFYCRDAEDSIGVRCEGNMDDELLGLMAALSLASIERWATINGVEARMGDAEAQ